jgi:hypothetical protein
LKRSVALGLLVLHTTAWADSLERKPPTLRVSLTGGAAVRDISFTDDSSVPLKVQGVAPTVVHLAGAYFFLPFLGVALDASFETFAIQGNDLVMTDANAQAKRQLLGARVLGAAAGRWSPWSWLGLELHLGYGGGVWPSIALDSKGNVQGVPIGWHGPVVGVAVALEPEFPVGGQVFARLVPSLGGNVIRPLSLSVGGQLHFLNLAAGELRAAIALDVELIVTGGSYDGPPRRDFNETQLRFGLGLRMRQQSAPPVTEVAAVQKSGNGRIVGRVVFAGAGLAGAKVSVGTLEATDTKADGSFEYPGVKPGQYLLRVVADGYLPAEQLVEVAPGEDAAVTVSLSKPAGPGRIKGVVRGEKEALVEGAEVALEGQKPVKSQADGSYLLEQAGPGPVKVTVKAKGYQDAEDAAQVPPAGVATLDFTLNKQGERQKATVRGLVKSASGKPVRAAVKIAELPNQPVPVKADGRFMVQVPAGKYTLTIEAPGYVTQVKSLEVAEGDQAIFHCDLQPAGR